MYKFKKTVNTDTFEKMGYKMGDKICVYDVQKVVRAGQKFWSTCFKVYNVTEKKMVWVDSFYCI